MSDIQVSIPQRTSVRRIVDQFSVCHDQIKEAYISNLDSFDIEMEFRFVRSQLNKSACLAWMKQPTLDVFTFMKISSSLEISMLDETKDITSMYQTSTGAYQRVTEIGKKKIIVSKDYVITPTPLPFVPFNASISIEKETKVMPDGILKESRERVRRIVQIRSNTMLVMAVFFTLVNNEDFELEVEIYEPFLKNNGMPLAALFVGLDRHFGKNEKFEKMASLWIKTITLPKPNKPKVFMHEMLKVGNYITPKLDGTRTLVICYRGYWFEYNNNEILYLSKQASDNISVYEAEKYNNSYFLFDIIVHNEELCTDKKFSERLTLFQHICVGSIIQNKKFIQIDKYETIITILEKIKNKKNLFDGFIYIDCDSTYSEDIFKWKFEPTIDLYVTKAGLFQRESTFMSKVAEPQSDAQYEKTVCEFTIKDKHSFQFYRTRPDKKDPNSKYVIDKTIEHKLYTLLDFDDFSNKNNKLFMYYLKTKLKKIFTQYRTQNAFFNDLWIPHELYIRSNFKKRYTLQKIHQNITKLARYANAANINNIVFFGVFTFYQEFDFAILKNFSKFCILCSTEPNMAWYDQSWTAIADIETIKTKLTAAGYTIQTTPFYNNEFLSDTTKQQFESLVWLQGSFE